MIAKLFGTDSFLTMLGMPKFWFIMAIIVGLIVALVYCIKYFKSGGKYVLLILFTVAMIALTTYSGVQLYYYYNAHGGIYGALTGIFNPNEVVVNELNYEFKNIELKEDGDNIYSADIIINEVMQLDKDTVYGVYVNNMPCDYVENAQDYVMADYTYKFYDRQMYEIIEDTLSIKFAFYTNSTLINISTKGGENAVKYWHYYLNKNTFIVTVKPTNYNTSDYLTYSNGDLSNYATLTFKYDDKTILSVHQKDTVITLPEADNKWFGGWYIGDELYSGQYTVKDNVTFEAKYNYVVLDLDIQNELKNIKTSLPAEYELTGTLTTLSDSYNYGDVIKVSKNDEMTIDLKVNSDSAVCSSMSMEVDTDGSYTDNSQDGALQLSWENITEIKIVIVLNNLDVNPTFGLNDWDTIADVSEYISNNNLTTAEIEATFDWHIGDEKDTTVNVETITLLILGFNHDDLSDGSGKAGISLGMKDCLSTTYSMNSTDTNAGGWDKSEMRTNTMATLLSQLPADLQKVIKTVDKKTTVGNESTAITTSSDKLWLCAYGEIVSPTAIENSIERNIRNNAAAFKSEGSQYDYYKNLIGDADPWDNGIRALVKNCNYWSLRSPNVESVQGFANIFMGCACWTFADIAYGVSFCLCI